MLHLVDGRDDAGERGEVEIDGKDHGIGVLVPIWRARMSLDAMWLHPCKASSYSASTVSKQEKKHHVASPWKSTRVQGPFSALHERRHMQRSRRWRGGNSKHAGKRKGC